MPRTRVQRSSRYILRGSLGRSASVCRTPWNSSSGSTRTTGTRRAKNCSNTWQAGRRSRGARRSNLVSGNGAPAPRVARRSHVPPPPHAPRISSSLRIRNPTLSLTWNWLTVRLLHQAPHLGHLEPVQPLEALGGPRDRVADGLLHRLLRHTPTNSITWQRLVRHGTLLCGAYSGGNYTLGRNGSACPRERSGSSARSCGLIAELDRPCHGLTDVKLHVRRHALGGDPYPVVTLMGAAASLVWIGMWRVRQQRTMLSRIDRRRGALD